MGYTHKQWMQRIAERTDISSQIVHLTRATNDMKLSQVMYEIISSKKLIGSTTKSGFICGGRRAVCFQDTPLVSVCQNVYYEQKYRALNPDTKTRYNACGISFEKPYAYQKGARPVIYNKTSEAKKYLPEDQWWRIVNLDLSDKGAYIDWSHEREWRAPGDFSFSPSKATLIFVTNKQFKAFSEVCRENDSDILSNVNGIIIMQNILY